MTSGIQEDTSSFRDPSGVVFAKDGIVYRQVNKHYEKQYRHLMDKGLYKDIIKNRLMVSHEETDMTPPIGDQGFLVIKPQQIPMISYPYEWCFGQLKDAALLTLNVHRQAMEFGMILKDASAYNVQFLNGRPIFIDTLSFDFYQEGMPWVSYGQFCKHFLAPLLLMAFKDVRLLQLLRVYIDGIPLDLASRLLGREGGMVAAQHIHLHAKATEKYGQAGHDEAPVKKVSISKFQHTALIDSLIRSIEKLTLKGEATEWGDYYSHTNYTDESAGRKGEIVSDFLGRSGAKVVWDFGANDGTYSRLALRSEDAFVVAFDIDPNAVGRNYTDVKKSGEAMLPLLLDLANPSPAIGFANEERTAITGRQKPECILSLALIHHLAISNNLPLPLLARWYSGLSEYLIIEFVPKEDSQVKKLLATRDDIFVSYTKDGFEAAFGEFFEIIASEGIEGTCRTMYLLRKR